MSLHLSKISTFCYFRILGLFSFLLLTFTIHAQEECILTGRIVDAENGEPIEFATAFIEGTTFATESNRSGDYYLKVAPGNNYILLVSRIGYKEARFNLPPLNRNSVRRIDAELIPSNSQIEIVVKESRIRDKGMIREEASSFKFLPSASGNFESILPSIALGTSGGTGGELTSQYNVRGGNYDENLVYINDFEIYRPQLIRAGQQEGLSFPNIDLMKDLSFSSGGFESRFGDKMSSVLDIRYKRPEQFKSSFQASLLGAGAHVEGSAQLGKSSYQKLRYLVGARYKTTKYLLGSLDVKGEYLPTFTDIQTYITYDLNPDWQLGFIANYNRSVYDFVPSTRSTAFGLIDFGLKLNAAYDGAEADKFTTGMAGLSLTYVPERMEKPFFLKFLLYTYGSKEREEFDIRGTYELGEIVTDLGSDEFGEVLNIIGSGAQQLFVRNQLNLQVLNFEHKGGLEWNKTNESNRAKRGRFLQWGLRGQMENVHDRINEWERLDSAGYSLPLDLSGLQVRRLIKSENELSTFRTNGYLQNTFSWTRDSLYDLQWTLGVRANYWNLNKEAILTPRTQLLYRPLAWKGSQTFKISGGLYYQPPFYRELRMPDGQLNLDLLSQKSAQILAGWTYDFNVGRAVPKKFRFITELYYKKLWDLVSYEVDNVRIQYAGLNNSRGYTTGIDLRLNGELVKDAESWINLSFLRSRESLDGIEHLRREVGETDSIVVKDVPRPTDQLFNFSMFVQDYLPGNKNFKMNMMLSVGSGQPFGVKDNNIIYRNAFRYKAYHRVDIGFTYILYDESRKDAKPNHPLRFTKQAWLSLEVFNLLQVANVASNTWIKTVYNTQYAIPNYLTSRRLNLKLRLDF
ncbi:MAG: TonB-dependent receptor [Saprospiraceae bacterium]